MTKKKLVVRLPDGKYVQDYEYSQGHFSMIKTTNLLKAYDFSKELDSFATFFHKREGVLEAFEITIESVAIPVTWIIYYWDANQENREKWTRLTHIVENMSQKDAVEFVQNMPNVIFSEVKRIDPH